MKNLILLSIMAMAAITAVADTGENQDAAQTKKSLVLYYSQTNTTKQVAEEIQRQTGADIEAIEVTEPYDGDFGATIMRCQKERAEGKLPTLKPRKAVVADYDIIYLGYPIWFGSYAPPISALVKSEDFAGKTVVPFCSFGSGGLETSAADLKAALPKATIAEGYGVRTARTAAIAQEVERFLKENGYVEGEVEKLPEYSSQQPVTAVETAIFNAACSDYQFPLGTPLSFGKRTTKTSTDYKFAVTTQTPDGKESHGTIYVTVTNGDSAKPEFTRVVR